MPVEMGVMMLEEGLGWYAMAAAGGIDREQENSERHGLTPLKRQVFVSWTDLNVQVDRWSPDFLQPTVYDCTFLHN